MSRSDIDYVHVDVFASRPYTGNSVAVVHDPPTLTDHQLATITLELRHFETIFVDSGADPAELRARVFDLAGELPFAGHPVLGAAAVQHMSEHAGSRRCDWRVHLAARTVSVETVRTSESRVAATLDQGKPEVIAQPDPRTYGDIAEAIGLTDTDLHMALRPEVISTGLRYLIVPVTSTEALSRAHIDNPDLGSFLARYGADFAYVLAADDLEGRHWNNDGLVEDVATGSAAGCVAAYLLRTGRARDGDPMLLRQGRFVGRPSAMRITAYGHGRSVDRVTVGGDVSLVASGRLHALPDRQKRRTESCRPHPSSC
jgi:PhzF family phenazine biosynthesis protein